MAQQQSAPWHDRELSQLGRYQVDQLLARGGMGEVARSSAAIPSFRFAWRDRGCVNAARTRTGS
jgi:hypothetical protein